ncbi:MAG: uroporphyrinogen decarboxylase family protein [Candidatus Heimdallarchaeaceae archaeon]
MYKLELLLDTFKGTNTEYPLFSLWKHFPIIDRDPQQLAKTHVDFYNKFDFDLMKISPHGRFPVVDYGCTVDTEYDPFTGSTRCADCCIESINDWQTLESLSVGEGELGKQIEVVRLIQKELEFLPKMMTVFSPLMVATKMDPNLVTNIRTHPETIIESMHILLDDITEYAEASIDAGAEGIFLASQHFRKTEFTFEEVKRFEMKFLEKFLSRIGKKADFTVLHVHGEDIKFKEAANHMKVEALNWHDRLTWPSLSEAADIFPKGLLAGIDETRSLVDGKPEDIQNNILDSIKQSKQVDNRIIIAPGCVIPITAPEKNIEIITKTIKKTREG